MNTKIIFLTLLLVLSVSFQGFAEESDVQIQKSAERTEAVVTPKKTKNPSDLGVMDRSFNAFENGVMGVAQPISYWTGKAVDTVVTGVEKAGGFIFSPLFRAIDFKNK